MYSYGCLANLTFSEIDFPVAEYIVKVLFNTIFVVECLLLPYVIVVIASQSVSVSLQSRALLYCEALFGFGLLTALFIYQPKIFLPFWVAAPNGLFDFGPNMIYIMYPTIVYFFIALLQNHSMWHLFRLLQCFPKTYFIYDNFYWCGVFYMFSFMIFEIIYLGPLLVERHDPKLVFELTVAEVPMMEEVYKRWPSTSGFHPRLSYGWLKFLVNASLGLGAAMPVYFGGMHGLFVWKIKRIRQAGMAGTLKQHKMLNQTLIVKTILLTCFIMVPFGTLSICLFISYRYSSLVATLMILSVGIYVVSNLIIVLIYVRPYRTFVLKCMTQLARTARNSLLIKFLRA